jgi:hypothetical protein
MLLSGLALAGANPRDGAGGDDGVLTALEASYLNLDGVVLVTLSACETAQGTATSGEGVLGLVSAFQMTAAPSGGTHAPDPGPVHHHPAGAASPLLRDGSLGRHVAGRPAGKMSSGVLRPARAGHPTGERAPVPTAWLAGRP